MADETSEETAALEALGKELQKLRKDREAEIELQQKLNKVAQNRISNIQQEATSYGEYTKELRTLNVEMAAYIEKIKAAGDTEAEQEEARKKFLVLKEEEIDLLEKAIELHGKLREGDEKELKFLKLQRSELEKTLPIMEKGLGYREKQANLSAQLSESKQAAEDLGKQFGATAGEILGIKSNWKEAGLTGRMLDAVDKGSSLTDVVATMKDGFVDMVNPTNMLASTILKVVGGTKELTGNLGSAFGQFKETTGGGDEYLDVLSDVVGENYAFGISTEESAAAVGTLYKELAMFNQMSLQAQTELGATVAKLIAFDVSASEAAEAADILMQGIGYTSDEFIQFEQRLKSMSSAIGVPMSKLHQQFGQASKVIAQYGKKGEQEFRKLAAAAKATGVEMGSLLEVAAQFDTFEDAAERVGSLNAILGGAYFDTVQMVNATEEERINLLRQGVTATGKSFDQLGRYEKKAIAAAAGIQDINEANKLFGTSTGAYEELQRFASDASMSLADLSDEAFNTLGPMQKFEAILKKLQKPLDIVLKLLDGVATLLFKLVEGWESLTAKVGITGDGFAILNIIILGLIFKFGKLWKVLGIGGKIFGMLGAKLPILGKLFKGAGDTGDGFAKKLKKVGKVAAKNAKGFLALGAAVLMVGAGIGLAAAGFALLVTSFKDLEAGEIVGALLAIGLVMYGMVAAIGALGAVSAAAAAPSWAFAAAILAIGAGVALAAYGLSFLVESFGDLVTSLGALPLDNLFALIGAVLTLATAGVFAGFGLMGIAVGITAIAAALILITDNEIDLLTKLFNSIGSITMEAATTIAQLATSIGSLTDVTIPVKLVPFMEAVGKVSAEQLKATEGITKGAAKLAAAKTSDDTKDLLEALTKLISSKGTTGAGGGPLRAGAARPLKINVIIDGKEAWTAMAPYAKEQIGVR